MCRAASPPSSTVGTSPAQHGEGSCSKNLPAAAGGSTAVTGPTTAQGGGAPARTPVPRLQASRAGDSPAGWGGAVHRSAPVFLHRQPRIGYASSRRRPPSAAGVGQEPGGGTSAGRRPPRALDKPPCLRQRLHVASFPTSLPPTRRKRRAKAGPQEGSDGGAEGSQGHLSRGSACTSTRAETPTPRR